MIPREPVKCTIHKRYKAVRKPTGQCEQCWQYYLDKRKFDNFDWKAATRAVGLDNESINEWARQHDDWINSPG